MFIYESTNVAATAAAAVSVALQKLAQKRSLAADVIKWQQTRAETDSN